MSQAHGLVRTRKGTEPRMTSKRADARAEAMQEAADHLDKAWTEDALEREEAARVQSQLRANADKWRDRAAGLRDERKQARN